MTEKIEVSWAEDIPGRRPGWYVYYSRRGIHGDFSDDNVAEQWIAFPDLSDLGPFDGDRVAERLRRAFPRATVEVER